MRLVLTNNLTKREVVFSDIEDLNTSRLFYTFSVILPEDADEGEYTYRLYDDNEIEKASGLCQIGDYTPEKTTYKKENNGFIQYQS